MATEIDIPESVLLKKGKIEDTALSSESLEEKVTELLGNKVKQLETSNLVAETVNTQLDTSILTNESGTFFQALLVPMVIADEQSNTPESCESKTATVDQEETKSTIIKASTEEKPNDDVEAVSIHSECKEENEDKNDEKTTKTDDEDQEKELTLEKDQASAGEDIKETITGQDATIVADSKEQDLNERPKGFLNEETMDKSTDALEASEQYEKEANDEKEQAPEESIKKIVLSSPDIEQEEQREVKDDEIEVKMEQNELLHAIATDAYISTEITQVETTNDEEKDEEEASIPSIKELCEKNSSEKPEYEISSVNLDEKTIAILNKDQDEEKEQEANVLEKDQVEDCITSARDVMVEGELEEKNHQSEVTEPEVVKAKESIEEDTEEIIYSVAAPENIEPQNLITVIPTDVSITTQTQSEEETINNNDDVQTKESGSSMVEKTWDETVSDKAETEERLNLSDSTNTVSHENEIETNDKYQEKDQELHVSEKSQRESQVTTIKLKEYEEGVMDKDDSRKESSNNLSIEEVREEKEQEQEQEEDEDEVTHSQNETSMEDLQVENSATIKNEEKNDEKAIMKDACEKMGPENVEPVGLRLSDSMEPSKKASLSTIEKDQDTEHEVVEETLVADVNKLNERPIELVKEETEDKSIDAQEESEKCENETENKPEQKSEESVEKIQQEEETEEISSHVEIDEKMEQNGVSEGATSDAILSTQSKAQVETTEHEEKGEEEATQVDDGQKEELDNPTITEVCGEDSSETVESERSAMKLNEKTTEIKNNDDNEEKEQEINVLGKDQSEDGVTSAQGVTVEGEFEEKNHHSEGIEPEIVEAKESIEEDTEESIYSGATPENIEPQNVIPTDVSITTQTKPEEEAIKNNDVHTKESGSSMVKEICDETVSDKAELEERLNLSESSNTASHENEIMKKDEDQELDVSEKGQAESRVETMKLEGYEEQVIENDDSKKESSNNLSIKEACEEKEQDQEEDEVTHSQDETSMEKLQEENNVTIKNEEKAIEKDTCEKMGPENVEPEVGLKLSDSMEASNNEVLSTLEKDQGDGDGIVISQDTECEFIEETLVADVKELNETPREFVKEETEEKSIDAQEESEECENETENKPEQKSEESIEKIEPELDTEEITSPVEIDEKMEQNGVLDGATSDASLSTQSKPQVETAEHEEKDEEDTHVDDVQQEELDNPTITEVSEENSSEKVEEETNVTIKNVEKAIEKDTCEEMGPEIVQPDVGETLSDSMEASNKEVLSMLEKDQGDSDGIKRSQDRAHQVVEETILADVKELNETPREFVKEETEDRLIDAQEISKECENETQKEPEQKSEESVEKIEQDEETEEISSHVEIDEKMEQNGVSEGATSDAILSTQSKAQVETTEHEEKGEEEATQVDDGQKEELDNPTITEVCQENSSEKVKFESSVVKLNEKTTEILNEGEDEEKEEEVNVLQKDQDDEDVISAREVKFEGGFEEKSCHSEGNEPEVVKADESIEEATEEIIYSVETPENIEQKTLVNVIPPDAIITTEAHSEEETIENEEAIKSNNGQTEVSGSPVVREVCEETVSDKAEVEEGQKLTDSYGMTTTENEIANNAEDQEKEQDQENDEVAHSQDETSIEDLQAKRNEGIINEENNDVEAIQKEACEDMSPETVESEVGLKPSDSMEPSKNEALNTLEKDHGDTNTQGVASSLDAKCKDIKEITSGQNATIVADFMELNEKPREFVKEETEVKAFDAQEASEECENGAHEKIEEKTEESLPKIEQEEETEEISPHVIIDENMEQNELLHDIAFDASVSIQTKSSQVENTNIDEKDEEDAKEKSEVNSSEKIEDESSTMKLDENAIAVLNKDKDEEKEQEVKVVEKNQSEDVGTITEDVPFEECLEETNHHSEGTETEVAKAEEAMEEDNEEITSSIERTETTEQQSLISTSPVDVGISTQTELKIEITECEEKNDEKIIESDDSQTKESEIPMDEDLCAATEYIEETTIGDNVSPGAYVEGNGLSEIPKGILKEGTEDKSIDAQEASAPEDGANNESEQKPEESVNEIVSEIEQKEYIEEIKPSVETNEENDLKKTGSEEVTDLSTSSEVEKETSSIIKDDVQEQDQELNVSEKDQCKDDVTCSHEATAVPEEDLQGKSVDEGNKHELGETRESTKDDNDVVRTAIESEEKMEQQIESQKETIGREVCEKTVKEVCEETSSEKVETEEGLQVSDSSIIMINEKTITTSKEGGEEETTEIEERNNDGTIENVDAIRSQNEPNKDIQETIGQNATTVVCFEEGHDTAMATEILVQEAEDTSLDAQENLEEVQQAERTADISELEDEVASAEKMSSEPGQAKEISDDEIQACPTETISEKTEDEIEKVEDSSHDSIEETNDDTTTEEKCFFEETSREVKIPTLEHEPNDAKNGGRDEVPNETPEVEPQEDISLLETSIEDTSSSEKIKVECEDLPIEVLESVSEEQIPEVVPESNNLKLTEEFLTSAATTNVDEEKETVTNEISSDEMQKTEETTGIKQESVEEGREEPNLEKAETEEGVEDSGIKTKENTQQQGLLDVITTEVCDPTQIEPKEESFEKKEKNDDEAEACSDKVGSEEGVKFSDSLNTPLDENEIVSNDENLEKEQELIMSEIQFGGNNVIISENASNEDIKETTGKHAAPTAHLKEEQSPMPKEILEEEAKDKSIDAQEMPSELGQPEEQIVEDIQEKTEDEITKEDIVLDQRTRDIEPQEDITPPSSSEIVTKHTSNIEDIKSECENLRAADLESSSEVQIPEPVPKSEESNLKEECVMSETETHVNEEQITVTKEISSDQNLEPSGEHKLTYESTADDHIDETTRQPEESHITHEKKDSLYEERDMKEEVTAENQLQSAEDCSEMAKDIILTKEIEQVPSEIQKENETSDFAQLVENDNSSKEQTQKEITHEISYSDPIPDRNPEVIEVTVEAQTVQEDLQAAEDISRESKRENDNMVEAPKEEIIPSLDDAPTIQPQVDFSNTESTACPSESEKSPTQDLESVSEVTVDSKVKEECIVLERAEYTDENKIEEEQKIITNDISSAPDTEEENVKQTPKSDEEKTSNLITEEKALAEKNIELHGEVKPASESMIEENQVDEAKHRPEQSEITSENIMDDQTLESKLEYMSTKDLEDDKRDMEEGFILAPEDQIKSIDCQNETKVNVILAEVVAVETQVDKTSDQNELVKEREFSGPLLAGNTEVTEVKAESQTEIENIQAVEDLSSTTGPSQLDIKEDTEQTFTTIGEVKDDSLNEASKDEILPVREDAKASEVQVNLPQIESTDTPVSKTDRVILEGAIEDTKHTPTLEFEKKEKDDELKSDVQIPEAFLKMEMKEEHPKATNNTCQTVMNGDSRGMFLEGTEEIDAQEDVEVIAEGEVKAIEESYQDAVTKVTVHDQLSHSDEKFVSMVPPEELRSVSAEDQTNELAPETDTTKFENNSISNTDRSLEEKPTEVSEITSQVPVVPEGTKASPEILLVKHEPEIVTTTEKIEEEIKEKDGMLQDPITSCESDEGKQEYSFGDMPNKEREAVQPQEHISYIKSDVEIKEQVELMRSGSQEPSEDKKMEDSLILQSEEKERLEEAPVEDAQKLEKDVEPQLLNTNHENQSEQKKEADENIEAAIPKKQAEKRSEQKKDVKSSDVEIAQSVMDVPVPVSSSTRKLEDLAVPFVMDTTDDKKDLESTCKRSITTEEVSGMKQEPWELDAPVVTAAMRDLEISQKDLRDGLISTGQIQPDVQKHEVAASSFDKLPHDNESKLLTQNQDPSHEQGELTSKLLIPESEESIATKAPGSKPQCSSEVFKEETNIKDKSESAALTKEEVGDSGAKTDEENEEEEDNENSGSNSEIPVMVEASKDMEVKAQKKSHNILSGVGSKVKHSIAKVKKAITGGKSSPTKSSTTKETI